MGCFFALGRFIRNGPGWTEYPDILKELNPSMDDNGLFWVTKEEFFSNFNDIYLCTMDMAKLQDPDYVNDLQDDFDHKKKSSKDGDGTGVDGVDDEPQPSVLDMLLADDDEEENNTNCGEAKPKKPPSEYKLISQQYESGYKYRKINEQVVDGKSVIEGVKEFKSNPQKYRAMHFQSNLLTKDWPLRMHRYTLIYHEGTKGLQVRGISEKGERTFLQHIPREEAEKDPK